MARRVALGHGWVREALALEAEHVAEHFPTPSARDRLDQIRAGAEIRTRPGELFRVLYRVYPAAATEYDFAHLGDTCFVLTVDDELVEASD